jgi:hypothetical protein
MIEKLVVDAGAAEQSGIPVYGSSAAQRCLERQQHQDSSSVVGLGW